MVALRSSRWRKEHDPQADKPVRQVVVLHITSSGSFFALSNIYCYRHRGRSAPSFRRGIGIGRLSHMKLMLKKLDWRWVQVIGRLDTPSKAHRCQIEHSRHFSSNSGCVQVADQTGYLGCHSWGAGGGVRCAQCADTELLSEVFVNRKRFKSWELRPGKVILIIYFFWSCWKPKTILRFLREMYIFKQKLVV
jgi:hypothetical protein